MHDDLLDYVQDQVNALEDWRIELGEHFDDALNRVVAFDYSPELAAAMSIYGLLDNPDEAFHVFWDRIEDLWDIRDEVEHLVD
jgi:hypothetical protein